MNLELAKWLKELSRKTAEHFVAEQAQTASARVYIGPRPDKRRKPKKHRNGILLIIALLFAVCIPVRASQQTKVSWNASTNALVVGYKIHYGITSGSYTMHVDAGTNTALVISGLKEGQTNFFVATAYDSAGVESAPSSEAKFLVPGLLHLHPRTNSTAPAVMRFPVAVAHWYEVQASTNLTAWTTIWQTGNSTSNSWVQCTDNQAKNYSKRFYRLVMH